MDGHKTIMRFKYAAVIETFAKEYSYTLRQALKIFMHSDVYQTMSGETACYHCRSDLYLAEDLYNERLKKQSEQKEPVSAGNLSI
jgi:hypothetical protein